MPICEVDPWRFQYFANVACPPDVMIPTDDADAFAWCPAHNWVYDKLRVAQSQGMASGTAGDVAASFPVFAKPRINLRGMGCASGRIDDGDQFRAMMTADHVWTELLSGSHLSTDAAVVDGEARWWRHTVGYPGPGGTFDYWHVLSDADAALESYCGQWLSEHMAGYTGMINFETIGGRIIEIHLRFADQWPDLYGEGWVEALVRLYAQRDWRFDDSGRREGYSVVLFGPHGVRYRHPAPTIVDRIAAARDISSVQITFHENRAPELHPMPPGGFRLAIVNTWNLAAGMQARETLSAAFALGGHKKRAS